MVPIIPRAPSPHRRSLAGNIRENQTTASPGDHVHPKLINNLVKSVEQLIHA